MDEPRLIAGPAGVPGPQYGEQTSTGYLAGSLAYRDSELTFDQIRKMRRHPVVKFCLSFIKMPLSRIKVNVQSDNEEVTQVLSEIFTEELLRGYLRNAARCLDFGFQGAEVIWEPKTVSYKQGEQLVTRQVIGIKGFKWLKPENATIRENELGGYRGIQYRNDNANGTVQSVVDLDPAKALLVTNVFEDGNRYGESELEACKKPWSRQENVETFFLRYLEGKADPIPKVFYDPEGTYKDSSGTTLDARTLAYNLAKSVRQGRGVALPSRYDEKGNRLWDIEYLEAEDKAPLYRAAMEHFDTKIMRSLLVPERSLTQAEDVGSYSMAESHGSYLIQRQEDVAAILIGALNEQVLPQVMAYNFGTERYQAELQTSGLSTTDKELAKQVVSMILATPDRLQPEQVEWLEKQTGIPFAKRVPVTV
ncbi:MAG: hypothetical protein PHU71_07465, partial [Candidatus Gracilibacteria bacterium]|nr:hypothetical protein [Candidatus Gracilibacteria bacterium]